MALGGPNLYPEWSCSLEELKDRQSRAYAKGCKDTREELRMLLSKMKGKSAEARLSACIAWATENLQDMQNLTVESCRCGCGTRMHECRQRANGSGCQWCGCPERKGHGES